MTIRVLLLASLLAPAGARAADIVSAKPVRTVIIPHKDFGAAIDGLSKSLELPRAIPRLQTLAASLIGGEGVALEATRIGNGPVVLVPTRAYPGAAGAVLPQRTLKGRLLGDVQEVAKRLRDDVARGRIDAGYLALAHRFDGQGAPDAGAVDARAQVAVPKTRFESSAEPGPAFRWLSKALAKNWRVTRAVYRENGKPEAKLYQVTLGPYRTSPDRVVIGLGYKDSREGDSQVDQYVALLGDARSGYSLYLGKDKGDPAALGREAGTAEFQETMARIDALVRAKEAAIAEQDYDKAAQLREQERALRRPLGWVSRAKIYASERQVVITNLDTGESHWFTADDKGAVAYVRLAADKSWRVEISVAANKKR